LPESERDIDHAGFITGLDHASFERGEAIYNRVCINCHGTRDRLGSLPTSLHFATGVFKNGADPFSMYRTLTLGFGQMTSQSWMVPEQKYDVIHYIREAYLRPHNPGQYGRVDPAYLARLARGKSRGAEPVEIQPMVLRFTAALDPQATIDVSRYSARIWSIKRTSEYGSDHYGERSLKITAASLSADGHTVFLKIPGIRPARCMEITYRIRGRRGETVDGVIHNTIHKLGDAEANAENPSSIPGSATR